MKAAQLNAFGNPPEVVECIDVAEPAAPAAGEALVDMLACPINPAELLLIQGKYASRPPLPARLGIEGVGRVKALGSGFEPSDLAIGDLVISMPRSNWAERCLLNRDQLIKIPADIDIQQAAMLKVNPATALLMLENYVDLQPGDWVIQNAANSGVGSSVIALAKARKLHTINVVRRDSLIEPLQAFGADMVLVDGEDLAERVRAKIGDGKVRLAIDAVAGTSCLRLGQCLDQGATVVNYGLLSGQPCQLGPEQVVFNGISLTGFWLAKELQAMHPAQTRKLYGQLARYIVDGTLKVAVEAVYPLGQVTQALAHAGKEGRDGKILIAPVSQ